MLGEAGGCRRLSQRFGERSKKERPIVFSQNMTKEFALFPSIEHVGVFPCRGSGPELWTAPVHPQGGVREQMVGSEPSVCSPSPLPSLFHVIFATFAVLTCQLQNNYYVTMAGGSYRRNLPSLNQR